MTGQMTEQEHTERCDWCRAIVSLPLGTHAGTAVPGGVAGGPARHCADPARWSAPTSTKDIKACRELIMRDRLLVTEPDEVTA